MGGWFGCLNRFSFLGWMFLHPIYICYTILYICLSYLWVCFFFFPSLLLWVRCFKWAFLVTFLTIHNHHRVDLCTWVLAFCKKLEKLIFLPLKRSLSKQYQSWLFHLLWCTTVWHLLFELLYILTHAKMAQNEMNRKALLFFLLIVPCWKKL